MTINNSKTRAQAIAIVRSSCRSHSGSSRIVDAPVAVARLWMQESTFGVAIVRELGGGVLQGGGPGS